MRLLVVSTCTNKKIVSHEQQLTLGDFEDPERLREEERELARYLRPASQMYTGQHHIKLMAGVRNIRRTFGKPAIRLLIISAGYGLVDESRLVAPYDFTFQGMDKSRIRAHAGRLHIPEAVREAIKGWPLVIFLLGEKYLESIAPPLPAEARQRLVFVTTSKIEASISGIGVTAVPVGKAEASRFGAGYISLKGRLFELYARALCKESEPLFQATCEDNTPVTFISAAERALRY